MDFDDIVVKESPGLCRCCLSEGCYKDLSTEYTWMDDTEIYADMLLDCFDISISQHSEGPNGANRLICEVCVTRLRDACNFKKQVLASEKKFVDMIGSGAFKPKAVTYNVPIKSEAILEVQPQETEVEYLEEGMDFADDDILKDDIIGQTSTEDITVSTLPIKGKKGKPKKTVNKTEKKSCSKIVLVEKPKISKPLTKGASLPVEDGPILAEVPAEVLYTVSDPPQHLRLPCSITGRSQNILYTWQKDGKPFDWSKHANVVKTDNEGTIVFLKPKDDDEGHYQCFATSDVGVASTRIITAKRAYLKVPKVTVQRHKPIEGSPFKLDCPIPDAYPNPIIEWRLQLESDPKVSNEVANSRYTVAPDAALYISSIEKSDTYDNFKYVCLASSPAVDKPVVLAEHYIEDLDSNKGHDYTEVVPQYLNQNQTLIVGERTYLFCIFGGNPLAHPDWFKDGEDVNNSPQDRITRYNKSKGKRLLIRDVWLSDEGKYVCKADNEKSTSKEHSFYVTVVSAPSFDKKPPTYIAAKEGEAVTIPCSVLAVPTAEISWTYNGNSLNRNGVNFNKSNENNRTITDLHIASVKKADGGYYGCNGVNQHGDVYAETLLRVA